MSDEHELLLLDKLTGLVHQYKGTRIDGVAGEESPFSVRVAPCGCKRDYAAIVDESLEHDMMVVIKRRHLDIGIWKPAPCLNTKMDTVDGDEGNGGEGDE